MEKITRKIVTATGETREVTDLRFTIGKWSVYRIEEAVRGLVRAARRAGIIPEPELEVLWESEREEVQTTTVVFLDSGRPEGQEEAKRVVPVVDCRVTVPSGGFRLEGNWRVVASLKRVLLQMTDEGAVPESLTNEIFADPEDLPKVEKYRHGELVCEHCRLKRIRSGTLVVGNRDGETRQLGTECATLYVGERAETAVQEMEFRALLTAFADDVDAESEGLHAGRGSGGGALSAWDAEVVAAHAVACVRQHGWQSSSIEAFPSFRPNPEATWRSVEFMLLLYPKNERDAALAAVEIVKLEKQVKECEAEPIPAGLDPTTARNLDIALSKIKAKLASLEEHRKFLLDTALYSVTEADREKGRRLVEWLAGAEEKEGNTYLDTLKAVYSPGWVSESRLRHAVSIVKARENAEKKEVMEKARATSQWVGTKGKREEFTLELLSATPYGGPFPGVAFRLRDQAGNLFSWMTGKRGLGYEPVGKTFCLAGTVAEHEEFRGVRITRLSRVKVQGEACMGSPLLPAEGTRRTRGR
ncbi:hypothetical protein OPIT5_00350 (plasmid) [Opitutaceae bacterium TAV5]|nr:hypothetical protein OPIT5_00350 [Opitutaceae bacterium TAV5]